MLGIGDYFWRLGPANPLLLRVLHVGGKRRRDLLLRCVYLGALIALVAVLSVASLGGNSLTELARTSSNLFQWMAYAQLLLVALLAPVLAAGAITQERDGGAYDILLSTPLTNAQIVLGSLLSRLFFIVALLISGVPVFAVTQVFGGVAIRSIVQSFLIATATATITAALAMGLAALKVGSRRTALGFYLFIALYLVGVGLADRLTLLHPLLATGERAQTSWLTAIHPFLALRVAFNTPTYATPNLADLPDALRNWPWSWYWTSPHTFYVWASLLLSAVLILPAVIVLRRLAQNRTPLWRRIWGRIWPAAATANRRPRGVWHNPVAWREARTKASATRGSVLRYAFTAAALLGALVILIGYGRLRPADRYIDRNSWDTQAGTLTIITADRATSYRVTPNTRITFDERPATLEELRGRYRVNEYTLDARDRGALASVSFAPLPRMLSLHDTRRLLAGAVLIELAVILLVVTNAAASAVTREKEDSSLDLILVTPITSRYYIWGKLRGLVSFVAPLIAVPLATVTLFVVADAARYVFSGRSMFQWVVFPEALLILPGMLVAVTAFAAILGMQMSLRCRTSVIAVMSSLGIVAGLAGVLAWGASAVLENTRSPVGMAVAGFSPFSTLLVLTNPQDFGGWTFNAGATGDVTAGRWLLTIFALAATGAYAAVVWSMYRSMVTNFDMTIRRQSR